MWTIIHRMGHNPCSPITPFISRSLNVRQSVALLCDADLWITIQLQTAVPSIMYHIVYFFCSTRYNFNIWIFRPAPVVDTSSNGLPIQTDPEVPIPTLCKFQMLRCTLYCICASRMILCQIWQLAGVHTALKRACPQSQRIIYDNILIQHL